MKITTVAAMVAAATLAGVGTSFADVGVPVLPARPLVAVSAPGIVGQTYPAFAVQHRPVVSERFATRTTGQRVATFVTPRQSSTTRFAQAQVGRVDR